MNKKKKPKLKKIKSKESLLCSYCDSEALYKIKGDFACEDHKDVLYKQEQQRLEAINNNFWKW